MTHGQPNIKILCNG